MTDKETIINKVNVNRCSVYKNGLCLISKEKCNAKCDYAAYYLYEQLERKEQECERLKKECEIWKNQVLTLDELDVTVQISQEQFEEYQKLNQECEEMKAEVKKQKEIAKEYEQRWLNSYGV